MSEGATLSLGSEPIWTPAHSLISWVIVAVSWALCWNCWPEYLRVASLCGLCFLTRWWLGSRGDKLMQWDIKDYKQPLMQSQVHSFGHKGSRGIKSSPYVSLYNTGSSQRGHYQLGRKPGSKEFIIAARISQISFSNANLLSTLPFITCSSLQELLYRAQF